VGAFGPDDRRGGPEPERLRLRDEVSDLARGEEEKTTAEQPGPDGQYDRVGIGGVGACA